MTEPGVPHEGWPGGVAPPLGIMPTHIWITRRLDELIAAMTRYRDTDKVIPVNWFREMALLGAMQDIVQGWDK